MCVNPASSEYIVFNSESGDVRTTWTCPQSRELCTENVGIVAAYNSREEMMTPISKVTWALFDELDGVFDGRYSPAFTGSGTTVIWVERGCDNAMETTSAHLERLIQTIAPESHLSCVRGVLDVFGKGKLSNLIKTMIQVADSYARSSIVLAVPVFVTSSSSLWNAVLDYVVERNVLVVMTGTTTNENVLHVRGSRLRTSNALRIVVDDEVDREIDVYAAGIVALDNITKTKKPSDAIAVAIAAGVAATYREETDSNDPRIVLDVIRTRACLNCTTPSKRNHRRRTLRVTHDDARLSNHVPFQFDSESERFFQFWPLSGTTVSFIVAENRFAFALAEHPSSTTSSLKFVVGCDGRDLQVKADAVNADANSETIKLPPRLPRTSTRFEFRILGFELDGLQIRVSACFPECASLLEKRIRGKTRFFSLTNGEYREIRIA